MQTQLLAECLTYLRSNPVFGRLLELLRDKYRSYGRVGGTICLALLDDSEREALQGFLRKNMINESKVIVQASEVRDSLGKTRFAPLTLEQIMEAYFGEKLTTKLDAQRTSLNARDAFFAGIVESCDSFAYTWLKAALARQAPGYSTLISRYNADPESLRRDLQVVDRALSMLPLTESAKVQLPVFAAELTGDPHALDEGTPADRLFVYALAHIFEEKCPRSASERSELLYAVGLYVNDITNTVASAGLYAYTIDGDRHEGWQGFLERGEPVIASLAGISELISVVSPCQMAYVVENPSVFSALLERASDPPPPLVCASGQMNLATLGLLDLLVSGGAWLRYSGDFDPEGLLIAQKLKDRYADRVTLWHFSPEDYEQALSSQVISDRRLTQLSRLRDPVLVEVANTMRERRLAGYQERIIETLAKDVKC